MSLCARVLPEKYDLRLYRGDSYAWSFVLWEDDAHTIPVDLTDATPAAELRNKPGGETIVVLACAIVTTPPGPGPERTNTVAVDLDAALWDGAPGLLAGAWDLEITYPDGSVRTVVAGKVTVTADVTHSTVVTASARVLRSA
jgi:hypothetical protein